MRSLLLLPLVPLLVLVAFRPRDDVAPMRDAAPGTVGASEPREPTEPTETGETCGAGCASAPTDEPVLDLDTYFELLWLYSREPIEGGGEALESLLFHAASARALAREHGTPGLDSARAELLRREGSRTTAVVAVRLVEPDGRVRARIGPVSVPLGEKQHVHADEVRDLQPLEVSGTVRRVGLRHLWARL